MIKNFLKKIAVVYIFCFALLSCKAQSYEAKYKLIYEISGGGISDTLKGGNEILSRLTIKVVIIYHVITDGKYLSVKGMEEGESTVTGTSINIQSTDTEIICDLTRELVYFPESGKYQRIKKYKLLEAFTKDKYLIENIDSSNFVELNSSLKNFISPGVFFSNNKHGIQKIHTPQYTIELMDPITKTNKKLSFQKQFEKVKIIEVEEEYSFF
jgi:hypothetical protein